MKEEPKFKRVKFDCYCLDKKLIFLNLENFGFSCN